MLRRLCAALALVFCVAVVTAVPANSYTVSDCKYKYAYAGQVNHPVNPYKKMVVARKAQVCYYDYTRWETLTTWRTDGYYKSGKYADSYRQYYYKNGKVYKTITLFTKQSYMAYKTKW